MIITGTMPTQDVGPTILPTVSEQDAFEYAIHIWFDAPGRRAAEELNSLPTSERERVWADLSGQPSISHFAENVPTPEDPTMVQRAFTDLRQLILQSSLEPLRSAAQRRPEYIFHPNYMIRFLRANAFDIPSAMDGLNRHLKMKETLFGQELLTRDIRLSDLNTDDQAFLARGVYQYLRETDRAGRAISFLNFADPYYTGENLPSVVRASFFRFLICIPLVV